jgi:hypothetical protein
VGPKHHTNFLQKERINVIDGFSEKYAEQNTFLEWKNDFASTEMNEESMSYKIFFDKLPNPVF